MAYEIEIEPAVLKSLRQIQAGDRDRIRLKIDGLAQNPRPAGAEKLADMSGWRIRSGNYRIVYRVEDTIRIVTITRVSHRGDVYRRH